MERFLHDWGINEVKNRSPQTETLFFFETSRIKQKLFFVFFVAWGSALGYLRILLSQFSFVTPLLDKRHLPKLNHHGLKFLGV